MSDLPPPLLSFLLYHRSMREGATRLAAALGAVSSGERGGRTSAVAAWFDRYRAACLIHAGGEDEVLWPALAEVRPDLGELFTAMDSEHHELSAALDRLAAALDAPAARLMPPSLPRSSRRWSPGTSTTRRPRRYRRSWMRSVRSSAT